MDGMVVVKGRLDPEAGAVLLRAIEAASDALYAADTEADATQPEQRRADALGLVAERALAAGLTGESGSRAERYQVMLHVESRRSARTASRAGASSETARAFPRKRPEG